MVKDISLQFGRMDTNRPTSDLYTIQHQIIMLSADLLRCSLQEMQVVGVRGSERVVGSLEADTTGLLVGREDLFRWGEEWEAFYPEEVVL